MPKRDVDTINRKELVTLIQHKLHQRNAGNPELPLEITDTRLEILLKAVLDTIKETVCSEKSVRIRDFGTFEVIPIKARKNHLPGYTVTSPATTKIRFKPCSKWKHQVQKASRVQVHTQELAVV